MKQIVFLIVLFLQSNVNAQTYYDVDDNIIDKATFDNLLLDSKYYRVDNDSLKKSKILNKNERGEIGSLGDVDKLFKELNQKLNLHLTTDKPLIIYYRSEERRVGKS